MRIRFVILLLLFFSNGKGQTNQPVLLGSADWKTVNVQASPDYLPDFTHKRKMSKKVYKENLSPLVSRKIDPGTEILSNRPLHPKTGSFTSSGRKFAPFKIENAPPLLTRDNQEFNISYTDRQHGFIADNSHAMTEDSEHNIWIATSLGIVKYDGYHYQLYNQKSGLPVNKIINVVYDLQKRLWIATDKGVYYIQRDSLFTIESKEVDFRNLKCRNIRIDRHQRVWVCTWENGAICINDNHISIYDKTCGLPNNEFFSVLVDKNENIFLVSSERGITILQKNRVIRMFHRSKQVTKNIFLSIEEDKKGIWLGGFARGLINLSEQDTIQYSMFGNYNERIYDIKKAKEGLWLSIYEGGLYFFNRESPFFIGEKNGLQSSSPYFLYQDSYQNIWISDLLNGFSRLNENSFFVQPFKNKIIISPGNIAVDDKGGSWIFTDGAGALYQKGSHITQYSCVRSDGDIILKFPQSGIIAKDGTVWMGSFGDGPVKGGKEYFTNFDLFNVPQKQVIPSVQEDKDQQLWFSTLDNGLIVYDRKKFWHYTRKTGLLANEPSNLFTDHAGIIFCGFVNGMQRFRDHQIETFCIDHKNLTDKVNYYYSSIDLATAFIGTENSGLLMIHNNKVYELSVRIGLLSNKILSIVQSADRKLWITTDKSIEYLIFEGAQIKEHKAFNQANGSYLINNTSVLLDASGNPYWPLTGPHANKKIVFAPNFSRPTYSPPFFSVDSVLIDNQPLGSEKQMSVLPNEKVTFHYTVKYWGRENYLTIQYLLIKKNGDSSFRPVDSKGHIVIREMVPGNYSICLIARDNGKMFMSTPFQLEVLNFWYNTWWFRSFILCLILYLVIYYFKQKAKKQLAINRLLTNKVKEQTIQLQKEKEELLHSYQTINRQHNERGVLLQEINHRVKNNLQFMIAILDMQLRSELPEVAKSALRSTSSRMNAMSLAHEMLYDKENISDISIKKYLSQLIKYFKSMVSEPANNVAFNLTIDDISVPMKPAISLGMIISELISNSIKHAFHNIPFPEIAIKTTYDKESDLFTLYYSDNGKGISQDTSSKKGLGNRLISIFTRELNGSCTIGGSEQFLFILTFNLSKQFDKNA